MLAFRFKFLVVFFLILFYSKVNAQNRISLDTINNAVYIGEFKLQSTESFISKYKYDSKLNLYLLENKLGNIASGLPLKLTPKEYREIFRKSLINNYFKEQISILEDENDDVNKRSLLPDLYVNSSFFESIFGSNEIDLDIQGSVGLDIGGRYSKRENPSIPIRNQSNIALDFNQAISLSPVSYTHLTLPTIA